MLDPLEHLVEYFWELCEQDLSRGARARVLRLEEPLGNEPLACLGRLLVSPQQGWQVRLDVKVDAVDARPVAELEPVEGEPARCGCCG